MLLGGPASLILQVGHPLVGTGVRDHSDYQTDPTKRLIGTMDAVLIVIFGDTSQAATVSKTIAGIHRKVQGPLSEANKEWTSQTRYSARDPHLALWVYATLIEMALEVYNSFVHRLSPDDRAQYYEELKPFGDHFGVTGSVRPPNYAAFTQYYQAMIDKISQSEAALDISSSIFFE